jgi:hypothetical protein
MSTLPNAYALVESCRIYGGGLNIGALYGRMKMESEGSPNRWYAIRASVAGYLTVSELRDVDTIYTSENPFSNVLPTPVPVPVPVLVMPITTTPTDASGLIFPSPDAPMAEQVAFYNGAAYQAYIAARQQSTAGYGFDGIFDNYVLNSVISYAANSNLAGGMDYMRQITLSHNQQLSNTVVRNLAQKGYDVTPSEAAFLLSGGSLTMVQSGTGTLISVERSLDPNLIVVTAPASNPPPAVYSPGFLSMLSTGLSFTPIAMTGGTPPAMADQNRSMSANEKAAINRIFGTSVNLDKVKIVFGAGGSLIAGKAFANGNPAITLGNTIYFNSPPHEFTSAAELGTLAHEMEHVRQYQTQGWVAVVGGVVMDAALMGSQTTPYQYWTRTLGYQYELLEGQAQIVGDYVAYRESNGALLPNYITAERLEIMANGSGVYGK